MIDFKISKDKKRSSIIFDEVADIQHAQKLHEILKNSLSNYEEIFLNLKKTNSIDISTLQIIWAANLQAKKEKRKIVFIGKTIDEIKKMLSATGYTNHFFPEKKIQQKIKNK